MIKKTVSLRVRHLISYVSITAITCMVIGSFVLVLFNIEVNSISKRDYRARMTLAVNDLDRQQEILESISHKVKISPFYRPFYAARNAYYEIEIVEDIAKFQDYSPIISEYYCLLSHNDSVYSEKGKLKVSEFITYKLGVKDGTLTTESFLSSDTFWLAEHPVQTDVVIAMAPTRVSLYGGSNQPDACMIFFITNADLQQRIEQISGLSADGLILYWNGHRIFGSEDEVSDDLLNVTSDSGGFRLYSTASVKQLYPQAKTFKIYYVIVLLGLTILFSIIALFWGKRNYYPLEHLITKLNIPSDGNVQDIEKEIKKLQEGQRYSIEQFQDNLQKIARQRREIAKRLLFAKLNMSQNEELDDLMADAGLLLNQPLFCVLVVSCVGNSITEGRMSALAQSISDEEIHVYSAGLYKPSNFILILNYLADGQEKEIASILRESLNLEDVEIMLGDVYDDVGMLHLSLISAFRHKNSTEESQTTSAPMGNWYDDRNVWFIMEAIKEGDRLKAHTSLDLAILKLRDNYPSILFQRCIFIDITNYLLKTVRKMDINVDDKNLHALLTSNDIDEFKREFGIVIDQICDTLALRKEKLEQNVIEYIKDAFYKDKFSIFEVAEHFGIPDRNVGIIVKKITGKTYKEFIIYLRIERAKVLLTEKNYTVAQTGEDVGYSNISYFIKLFRNTTGYTPGEYKKKFE